MIRAWVLYRNQLGTYKFRELDGISFKSTHGPDWGLLPTDEIILVLQQASFLQIWIEGKQRDPRQ